MFHENVGLKKLEIRVPDSDLLKLTRHQIHIWTVCPRRSIREEIEKLYQLSLRPKMCARDFWREEMIKFRAFGVAYCGAYTRSSLTSRFTYVMNHSGL